MRLVALVLLIFAGIACGADAESLQRLGLTLHLQNKYAEAIPAFREAIRLNPSLWTSHLFLGICLYRTNEFDTALTSIQRADRFAPTNTPGRDEIDYWLGATHIALRKPLAGLQRLERLLARNPRHTDALELVTRAYADVSSSLWNEVAEKHFATAPGYEVHGFALQSEGNRKDALQAFRASKELNPRRAGPGLEIGRLLLHDGKAEEALAVLQRELALPDAGAEAPYYAGLAAIQLGRYTDAAPLLKSAARWLPRNPEAPLALAQVYLALKEPGKAVAAAQQAVAVAPASPAAHELLLAALIQTGQTDEVEKEKQRWHGRASK